jgi:4-hydroxysphinganine ceramide fatty acyl 2-hydroxylase
MTEHYKKFFGHGSILTMLVFAVAEGLWLALGSAGDGGSAGIASGGGWGGFAERSVWIALVVGAALFFLTEYTTHRFLFHMPPPQNQTLLKFLKRLHYDHHELPRDLHLLFLPAWYVLPQQMLMWGIAYLIFGAKIATAFVLGSTLGLFYYEWVHFAAHRTFTPWTRWGRWMKKVHLWHHYKSEHYWFGVTHPLLDHLFGTWRKEKAVELSPTARNLLQQDEQV